MKEKELIELAKEHENTIQTKRNIVDTFGSDNQKNHFNKYGKFKNKKKEEPLLRTLNQYFESVEIVKQGRNNNYQLGAARAEVAQRESRDKLKGNKSESTKHLDVLLLLMIQKNMKNNITYENSISKWMKIFGVVNQSQYQVYSSTFDEDAEKNIKDKIRLATEENTVDYSMSLKYESDAKTYFYDDFNSKKSTFMSALNRFEKNDLINTNEVPVAYLHKGVIQKGKKVKIVGLHKDSFKEYKAKQKELLEAHELNLNTVYKSRFWKSKTELNNRVENYKNDLNDFLRNEFESLDADGNEIKIHIKNIYKNIEITSKVTEDKIEKYIKDYYEHTIYQDYINQDETDFFMNQMDKYDECKRVERVNKVVKKMNEKVEEAKEEDENFGEDGFRASDFEINYIGMRAVELYRNDFVNLINSLNEEFKSGFDLEKEIHEYKVAFKEMEQSNNVNHEAMLEQAYESMSKEDRELWFAVG
ncbi:hypothetical protein [Corticicoccus populi]|uniref:Uncharacterized protein n=1 Tax=Corticicoccus populi TaxID=1812821 RepID=A0ABW5WV27_9STAP